MKKHLLSLLTVTIAISGFTQNTMVTIVSNYSGTVGTYPIQMRLEHNLGNDSIWGEYYYSRKGADQTIYLDGIFLKNKTQLSESFYNRKKDARENTGNFLFNTANQPVLSGTWTGTKNNELPAQLKRYENNSIEDFKKWKFQLSLYKSKEKEPTGLLETYTKANALKIYNATGQLSQTLAGFDEVMYEDYGAVILEDLNFDGYADLKIPIYYPEAVKNDGSILYFIYNPSNKKFVASKGLNNLGYLTFNPETKEFTDMTADGNGNEVTYYYRWQGEEYYLVRDVRVYEDKKGIYYTEYAIRNGKSVKVKEYKK